MPVKSSFSPVNAVRVWNAGQSWNYQQELKHTSGRLVRVALRRNAYDPQSYKSVLVYDAVANRWNDLVRLPLSEADACYKTSYVVRALSPAAQAGFAADAAATLALAANLLNAL